MRHQVVSIASVLAIALCLGGQAVAQQSPKNPPSGDIPKAMPFDIPYGLAISADKAKQIVSAAEAEAKKRNWKMNIAVVDPDGELIHFLRMDGAQIASVAISQGKARTAARYRRPTQVFYNAFESGHPYVATLDPTLVASPGGFPLIEGGKVIGAIGCSGGTGAQDALVCKVGADMIK
jgi:uncharacterized protein GlcG (DUF336 family)